MKCEEHMRQHLSQEKYIENCSTDLMLEMLKLGIHLWKFT